MPGPSFTFTKEYPQKRQLIGQIKPIFLVSIIFLVLVILIRLGTAIGETVLVNRIQDIQNEALALSQNFPASLRQSILEVPLRVKLVNELVTNHIYGSSLFDFLRRNTLKEVIIDSVRLDTNSLQLQLGIKAVDVETLSRQLVWFKSLPTVTDLMVSGLALESGTLTSQITLKLSDTFFRK